ncbi:MAG: hypothetical protein HY660_11995 [Armatimonadetes bacterium]|nr:hypothetical protein [Armatimonadota bacterium]
MIKHIGFTERWLRRARVECEEGAVARGVLTLSLAEAEIRRARELGVAAVARGEAGRAASAPRRQFAPVAVGILSLLLVLAIAMVAVPQALPLAIGPGAIVPLRSQIGVAASSTPAVTFDRPVGALLAMVQTPPEASPVPAPAAVAAAPQRQKPHAAPEETLTVGTMMVQQPAAALPVRVAAAEGPARVIEPGPAAAAREEAQPARAAPAAEKTTVPQARPVVDGGDLIDLVLVAERTLRGPRF